MQPLETNHDARWRIALLNGLNMSNLGNRDKNVYGTVTSLQELESLVADSGQLVGATINPYHSNHEGDLVDFVEADTTYDGYLINPGGLWAFGEPTRIALTETGKPFVEVHFANIFATGNRSTFTQTAAGTAMGFRHHGYIGALVALVSALEEREGEATT
ncbi:3-dehydroquinate dehydratase [Brevibacterium zhoupengii]|uniref:type II 3-dehydroquinate dehydratase n=1 Tax=Brevibacterium zhoupengii TaxID=2898795 RepID=UPI0021D42228|nr:3-dehydroquinate dehydratase [Brevibacterium zhoupengii]